MQSSEERLRKAEEDDMASLDAIKHKLTKENSLHKQNDKARQTDSKVENKFNTLKKAFMECDDEGTLITFHPNEVGDVLTSNEEKPLDISFNDDENFSLMKGNKSSLKSIRALETDVVDEEGDQETKKLRNLQFVD